MKRLFAFMMALALILSLSVTAFADGGTKGSITITNALENETYSVYKIFDATYEGPNVTYTITAANPFFAKLFGSNDDTVNQTNEYFAYYAETGVVTRTGTKTDAQLFTYLSTLIAGMTPTKSAKAEGTTLTIGDATNGYLDTGYYVIDRTNGQPTGVTITTVKPTAEVNDKNAGVGGDFDKSADKDAVAVGDTITWTVSFTALNYADGKKVLSYTVKDALDHAWAEIDYANLRVFVNDAPITGWSFEDSSASGFIINIPWVDSDENSLYPATSQVKVVYTGTVLDAAAANDPANADNVNNAEMEYTHSTGTEPGGDDVTETDVFNMGFTKVDGTNPSKTLAGATFTLWSDSACTQAVMVKAGPAEGVYVVDPESGTNTVVTPAGGQVVIMGLPADTYYLKETIAPDGYNLLDAAQPVEVGNGGVDELTIDSVTYTVNNAEINIQNFSGVELPSTGGEGTMMMITFGTLVAMAFAVLMITQKKMSIYQD